MIEKIYSGMIRAIRTFTNSIDRSNKEEQNTVIITLTEIILVVRIQLLLRL